ncbi:Na+/H+ antiporter subunit E [Hydrogenophaga pseudoflava]|uniref:Na+/H+ antiporter subunit E n=1 Tax=Hydrogenophaga pseudoflava TaxID=47421 RepID=UPI0027E5B011|nr:Na+/H+ antiporter subunit E [Hydrogenophaga pseudoflava]MDQ7744021.1 Na+/H+ antiporter subunit E [Hydrogenophaga pseudoflava]
MKSDTLDRRRGWFAHPVLSLLLAACWLALSRSLEPAHLLSAALLGLVVARLMSGLLPAGSPIRWSAAVRLTFVVTWDIVVSNITVARLVLGPMSRPQPAWLRVPLACDHHRVNALFASIITMTPGTVSAVVDEAARCIWVHALNCDDAAGMVADMKARYEAPLMAVFGLEGEGAA